MSSSDFLEDLVEKNIRIGNNAGQTDQGDFSIAIGNNAGVNSQDDNTIILNAKSQELNTDTSNAFYVKPVRNSEGTSLVQYDICSGEITHSNQISENLDLSCNLLNDVSGINFCDGTFIGQGNSFDISTSQILKINNNALVVNNNKNIGIGTTQPSCVLDISSNGAIQLPAGTEDQKPLSSKPGMIRYNTDFDHIEVYSRFTLKWIPIQNGTNAINATGGTITNISENDINYKIHAFTDLGPDTFEVISGTGYIDILVVAGGGGGGRGTNYGGGGGAGGLIFYNAMRISSSGVVNINIGDGGDGAVAKEMRGENGEDTTVNGLDISLIAIGGGGGGAQDGNTNGKDGGSGGGGAFPDGSGGDGIQSIQSGDSGGPYGFGNNGGNGNDGGGSNSGGGGGGAFSPGSTGTSTSPSDGGFGLYETTFDDGFGNLITYDFATTFGTIYGEEIQGTVFFAGGGGGTTQTTGGPDDYALGGFGGGGSGSYYDQNTQAPGLPNTGGGGGAGGNANVGKKGGSGIVLIRYAT